MVHRLINAISKSKSELRPYCCLRAPIYCDLVGVWLEEANLAKTPKLMIACMLSVKSSFINVGLILELLIT